ncbi:MAG: histidinol-phosphatase [Spirochaetaceae bacterium]|nr:histidinol-phosphatase [Spirochaetaceae bacterium]
MHTHTVFCDGHDDIETFCRVAGDRNFAALGFSAHAPIRRKTGFASDWHLEEDRLGEYMDAVRAARRRWEGKLAVFLGLEVDYVEGLVGPADRDIRELDLDYRIGSVHYLVPPAGEPFTVDGSPAEYARGLAEGFGGDEDALAAAYWGAVCAMIRAGGFDILGHIDLIKKNARPREPGARLLRLIDEAADLLGRAGIVAEVNTGGMIRYGIPEPYPGLSILRTLKARGVPVTVTADAHRAEHLGGHYETARDILLEAGYDHALIPSASGCSSMAACCFKLVQHPVR